MEVSQGLNWGCSAKGKKKLNMAVLLEIINQLNNFWIDIPNRDSSPFYWFS
jgi:hypothetical protein